MKPTQRFAALLFTAALAGCAAQVDDDHAQDGEVAEADDGVTAAVSLPFKVIDARKSAAPAGLRVIESLHEYKSFFGTSPPAGVDFAKHHVVHYSLGVKPTGGFSVDVTKITRRGTSGHRSLEVDVRAVSPGPKCMVTQALTNPQVTVRIAKQSGVKQSYAKVSAETKICGSGSECTSADQCPGSKIACRLCADGTAACPQTTCNAGVCGIRIDQCPEEVVCGGIAGVACPKGYSCVDDATDSCDPADGGADCSGKCQKDCTGPMPSCAAPPAGCHYEGLGCVNGNYTCGKLVCGASCGDTVCGDGTVCCNPLLGICTKPGMACIQ